MASPSQPMNADPSQHRQELIERLDILRTNQSFCDVTVAVKDGEFNAHKVVLAAASPFFLSLLASDMRESKEQLIKIELEEATASVMEDVLQYVYTGNVSITEERAHNVIATADYLLLPGLKTMACKFLKENMTIENCIFNYYFADKYQCVDMKENAREVINSNFSAVIQTDDFLSLDMKQVMEWVSSDDVTVNAEEEVFKGIVKWVSHNRSEREADFAALLHQVRLISISHEYLFNDLVEEELIKTNNECLNFVLAAMKQIFHPADECVTKSPRKCLETRTDVIFVCGGRKSLCYVPNRNMWCQLADMLFEHQNHAATQYKDKIFVFGGQPVGPGQSRITEYYMSLTNSWGSLQMADFVYEDRYSSLSVLNGCMYASGCETGMVYAYFPEKNDWDILDGLSSSRWGACGFTDGKYLYIIGGTPMNTYKISGTVTTERFDPSGNSWEEVAAMNEARHDAFGAAMNGKLYIAGGQQKKGQICTVLCSCEVYNPLTNEWQLIPSLNVPRHAASMVCFKGELYVLGGFSNGQSIEYPVEVFSSETNEWKKKSTIPVSGLVDAKAGKSANYCKACFATIHIKNIDFKKKLK
ncbi:kelch-like protein 3 [Oculina patagonica]